MRYEYMLDVQLPAFEQIAIVDVCRPKGYKHSYSSGRTKNGFVYVRTGEVSDVFLEGEKKTVHLRAGEVIFIPKGCPYVCTYLADNTELRVVHFDTAAGSLPPYLQAPVKIDLPDVQEAINAFFTALDDHVTYHPFYYLSCLYRLLWQIDEGYTKLPPKYARLQPALHDIATHCERAEPILYYARLCHMSETNFRRLFREYTGTSPIEYRNGVRLNSARAKLQSGEHNVFEAAAAVGFTNLSFFIRLYKRKFGHTPGRE